MLRYVLLALMADGRPTHGYALMKAFAERSGVHASIGNVYRELQRLLGEGLIVTVENPAGADARRAPYVITAAGRAALAAWLAAPAEAFVRTAPDAIVYRLALVADVDAAQAAAFLDDLHAELASQLRVAERDQAAARLGDERTACGLPTRTILLGRRARAIAADAELVAELRRLVATRRRAACATRPPTPRCRARR